MTSPTVGVRLELNHPEAGTFIVGSSLVGGPDVIGDGLTDICDYVTRLSIRRGRWGQLYDDFEAASISVVLNNETRLFDPVYASGDYFGEIVPGRDIEILAGGVPIVTGFVQDWDLDYDISGRSVAILKATDALGRMAALNFDAWTSTGRTASVKLDAVCNRAEVNWSSSLRDFIGATGEAFGVNDAGDPTGVGPVLLQPDTVSWGSNVGAYMNLIARSDWLSWLFVAADGVLTLRPVVQFGQLVDADDDPTYDIGAAVATFGTGGIGFRSITAQYGSETLFSEVSVDFEGGVTQTSTVADPAAWQSTYGPQRRLSQGGLLLTGITDAELLADDLLAFYEAPIYRITEFSLELAGLSGPDQATVLGIDIAQPVTVTFTPNGVGSAISQTLAVQGIAHEVTPDSHIVTFNVIDYGA